MSDMDMDDNACGFDNTINLDEQSEDEEPKIDEPTEEQVPKMPDFADAEATDEMFTRFAELWQKKTDEENERLDLKIADLQKQLNALTQEKMSLLCSLCKPDLEPVLPMVKAVEKVQKELSQKLHMMKNVQSEYLDAYSAHCDEAIKSAEALGADDEYDEFTEMSNDDLRELIAQMEAETEETNAKTVEMRATRLQKQKDHEIEYNSIMEEVKMLKKYKLEALETVEMLEFQIEKNRRGQNQ